MTFRVRPVDRGRAPRNPNRRTFYMNVGFGVTVVLAILILVTVAATTWYGKHLAAAATVDGQTITRDQFTERTQVEVFRLQQLASRIEAEVAAGRLTAAQAEARTSAISSQLDDQSGRFSSTIIEKLIDTRIQAKLAAELGITIPQEEIDRRIAEDRTRKEERHVWLIAVEPEVDTGKSDPTADQKAAAKKKADEALAAIKSGTSFEDAAKKYSTDPSRSSGGDLAWLDDSATEDPAWQKALFALEAEGVTDVILGEDGTYRIGRVSEIVPAEVDPAWDQKLADAGISQEAYRAAIVSEATRKALEDRVVADLSKPGLQRQVQELFIAKPQNPPGEKAIKTRHILFSPKDDPGSASTVPESDPEWTKAQLGAQAAYDKLKKDPKQFDAIARKESDEASAQGKRGSGGKLPYFDTSTQIDQAFADAIFADGLQPGDLIPPFKSSFGWHVVQVMYRPPDIDQMTRLKAQAATPGTNFAQLARDFSEGEQGGDGGNLGWVMKGTLDDRLVAAIEAAPVGGLTGIVDLPNAGLYLFKVIAEKTAPPDEDQLETIKDSAFGNWYASKKDAVKITRDLLGG